MIKIILFLCSLNNTGDMSQCRALIKKFEQKNPSISYHIIDANRVKTDIKQAGELVTAKITSETAIIAIDKIGLEALDFLNKNRLLKSEVKYIGASVHQYFDLLKQLPINYLAITEAGLSDSQKADLQAIPTLDSDNISYMLTVPSDNPSVKELEEVYKTSPNSKDLKISDKYIIVMLPGDAPVNEHENKLFTKDSALQLFHAVRNLKIQNPRHRLIIQNGPRTGKLCSSGSGKIIGRHEYHKHTEKPEVAIDDISKYFIGLLSDAKIAHTFFNFSFELSVNAKDGTEIKKAQSVFKQLLYLAQSSKDNYFIVPGESVSMLGQVALYMQPSQVLVFEPSSMNDSYRATLNEIFERGHLSKIVSSNPLQIIEPEFPKQLTRDDAEVVSDDFLVFVKNIKRLNTFLAKHGGEYYHNNLYFRLITLDDEQYVDRAYADEYNRCMVVPMMEYTPDGVRIKTERFVAASETGLGIMVVSRVNTTTRQKEVIGFAGYTWMDTVGGKIEYNRILLPGVINQGLGTAILQSLQYLAFADNGLKIDALYGENLSYNFLAQISAEKTGMKPHGINMLNSTVHSSQANPNPKDDYCTVYIMTREDYQMAESIKCSMRHENSRTVREALVFTIRRVNGLNVRLRAGIGLTLDGHKELSFAKAMLEHLQKVTKLIESKAELKTRLLSQEDTSVITSSASGAVRRLTG